MNCPHCGAAGISGETRFDCGTNRIPGALGTITCYTRQIAALKADLEQAKADRAQMVRRDHPWLAFCELVLRQMKGKDGVHPVVPSAHEKIQSIISGS